MASFTIRCYTSNDPTEEPVLKSRDLSKPIDVEAMRAEGIHFLEAWVSADVDLSQYGWVKSNAKVSVYGNQLWVFPRQRLVVDAPDFPE